LGLLAGLRQVLKMQLEVNEYTVRLQELAEEQHGPRLAPEAERLSRSQRQIVGEVEKLIVFLRQDGTTVAFPETLEFIREDMQLIAQRIAQSKVDRKITQAIQNDIIDSLEEMIAVFD
jgi:hypothetical protein